MSSNSRDQHAIKAFYREDPFAEVQLSSDPWRRSHDYLEPFDLTFCQTSINFKHPEEEHPNLLASLRRASIDESDAVGKEARVR